MLFPFSLLDRIAVDPSDLLDLLAARSGHAFLPETQRRFVWQPRATPPDEVVLTNFARNRWDLGVPKQGGYARGISVPVGRLFDTSLVDAPATSPRRIPSEWARRSGTVATIAEILRAGKIPPERCHWSFLKRRLLVRFDPARLESGLPDLASAVGGRYEAATKTIAFAPREFRESVRASIPEAVYDSPKRSDLEWGLTRIGILKASDAAPSELFSTPINSIKFKSEGLSDRERGVVDRYIAAVMKIAGDSGKGQLEDLLSLVDFKQSPTLKVLTTGMCRIGFIARDGKTTVDL